VNLMRAGVGNIQQIFARLPDEIGRDVDPVNFKKVAAHGPHQASGAAPDFERAPIAALLGLQPMKLRFEIVYDPGGCRQKLRVALAATPEGYVIAGINGSFCVLGIRHEDYLRLE